VSGVVIIEATLGPDGNVVDARVIRSIALLDRAAVDAVKQWKYTPTTMNGMAVPVIMTVTVNFTLQGAQNPASSSDMSSGDFDAGHPLMQQSSEPVTLNGKPAIRIGGETKAPERTKYVAPLYPEIAQSSRISGVVIIEAVIDEAGRVATANVLRSIPLLDQAAIDAVLQWEYAPTLLNGVPVPVVMTVTVNFTLQ
jgi:protein TonB